MRFAQLVKITGSLGARCQICGISMMTQDVDKECRDFEVDFGFGPNLRNDVVDEAVI